jgi:hypothetical protein
MTPMCSTDLFTHNKQKVREMDAILIERHFRSDLGNLRYIGLPASTLTDLAQWKEYFNHFSVVERGQPDQEFIYQHDLMLSAMRLGISRKLSLLRGDLDDVLLNGKDIFGNPVKYPFDVVSLDYSGGILYKDPTGAAKRPESISKLCEEQAQHNLDFLLFLSTNMDIQDQGEIKSTFDEIQRDLSKIGIDVSRTTRAYRDHPLLEARLKVYVPYMIRNLTSRWFRCTTFKPIYYAGNKATRMMHFSFWLERTDEAVVGRPNKQTIIQLLDLPAFECTDGNLRQTSFEIDVVETAVMID